MIGEKGTYLDSEPLSQPVGTTREFRNILATKLKGVRINEPGFSQVASLTFPQDAKIIGNIKFSDSSIVYFITRTSGTSTEEIGILINDTYTKLLGSDDFGFDINYPIKGVGTFDGNGDRIIAWTDENTLPRILNINTLPFDVDVNKDIIDPTELINTLLFPESNSPLITADTKVAGSLETGAYYITVAYEDNTNTRTEFHIPFGPIYINDDSESVSSSSYDGSPAGQNSGKGIKGTLTNVDLRYSKLVIAIISKINGIIKVNALTDIAISSTVNFIYTGTETTETLTLDEVLLKQPNYNKVRDLAILKDTLYAANMHAEEDIDYQPQANNIIVNYRVTAIDVSSKDNKIGNLQGLMPGQVYALYIRWILTGGKVSKGYHIPGRAVKTGEEANSTNATTQDIKNPDNSYAKVYQIDNTCDANGQSYNYTFAQNGYEASVIDKTKSNLGFWKNQNEVYPSDFPGLAGQNVRHHVMPTLAALRTKHFLVISDYGVNKMPQITLDVSNVIINSGMTGKVIGYQILAAKIDITNSNVLGYDQLLYAHNLTTSYGDTYNVVWTAGGNWRYRADTFALGVHAYLTPDKSYLRSHIFDLLKNKPSISPTYIKTELKYTRINLNDSFSSVGSQGGKVQKYPGDIVTTKLAMGVIDNTASVKTTISNSEYYRKCSSYRYLPSNVIIEDGSLKLMSLGAEECLLLKIDGNTSNSDLTTTTTGGNPYSGSGYTVEMVSPIGPSHEFIDSDATGKELSFLYSINQLKTDVFVNFNSQELIVLGKGKITPYNVSGVDALTGDCFIGIHGYVTAGPYLVPGGSVNLIAYSETNTKGAFIVRAFSTICRNNINMRHINDSIGGSKYYPKIGGLNWISGSGTSATFNNLPSEFNVIEYNDDYSSKNDLLQTEIYVPLLIEQNIKFPNRIIRSAKATKGINIIGAFRTYAEQDFYEANYDKGSINNIEVIDDILFIHHKYSLLRTVGKETLKATTVEIFLGSRDIFELDPKEMIPSKDGYLGNQHKFGTLTFEGGYAFCDANQGKAFIVSVNGVIEISNIGLRNWFISNIKGFTSDNPFNGEGLLFAIDIQFQRLLFTKVSSSNPITRSFSINEKQWISTHDYIPKSIISTRTRIISSGIDGKLMKHNDETKRGIYYDNTIYPSSLTFIINNITEKNEDLLFYNINWITHLFKNGIIDRNKTFTKIRLKNSYQDTGDISLIVYNGLNLKSNVRLENNTWNFNSINIQDNKYYKKARFVDKYIEIFLEYNNSKNLDDTQNLLYLYDVGFSAIKAER